MLSTTAWALKSSPLWNLMPGCSLITQLVKVSLAYHESASHGLADLSSPTVARGSSTEETTRLPVSAIWLVAGFQPLVSAAMPMTRLPPSTGVPSSTATVLPSDAVDDVASVFLELPQAMASNARAMTTARRSRGVRRLRSDGCCG